MAAPLFDPQFQNVFLPLFVLHLTCRNRVYYNQDKLAKVAKQSTRDMLTCFGNTDEKIFHTCICYTHNF